MSGNVYQQEMTWICGQGTSSVSQPRFWQLSKNESNLDLADSSEKGEKWPEFKYIKCMLMNLRLGCERKKVTRTNARFFTRIIKINRIPRNLTSGIFGLRRPENFKKRYWVGTKVWSGGRSPGWRYKFENHQHDLMFISGYE